MGGGEDGCDAGQVKVGIIGGSGLEDPDILENARKIEQMDTPYGRISDYLVEGEIGGVPCVLLSRHGRDHSLSPTHVNYRANIWALAEQGVTVIIASTACGSLQENIMPGDLLFPDSVYDRTTRRESSFFDALPGHLPGVCHTQMHPLYHEKLRQVLISCAEKMRSESSLDELVNYHSSGFAVCIEGPRFSTRAESNVFRSWGASIVNMTMLPEAALVKELGIPYATMALITDYDCWKEDEHVSVERVMAVFKKNSEVAKKLLVRAVGAIAGVDWAEDIKELKKSVRCSVMLPSDMCIPFLDCNGSSCP